ncbi:unnamed protein product, partial [Urochloa humidicola]
AASPPFRLSPPDASSCVDWRRLLLPVSCCCYLRLRCGFSIATPPFSSSARPLTACFCCWLTLVPAPACDTSAFLSPDPPSAGAAVTAPRSCALQDGAECGLPGWPLRRDLPRPILPFLSFASRVRASPCWTRLRAWPRLDMLPSLTYARGLTGRTGLSDLLALPAFCCMGVPFRLVDRLSSC